MLVENIWLFVSENHRNQSLPSEVYASKNHKNAETKIHSIEARRGSQFQSANWRNLYHARFLHGYMPLFDLSRSVSDVLFSHVSYSLMESHTKKSAINECSDLNVPSINSPGRFSLFHSCSPSLYFPRDVLDKSLFVTNFVQKNVLVVLPPQL